jgi:hypothetical protein
MIISQKAVLRRNIIALPSLFEKPCGLPPLSFLRR